MLSNYISILKAYYNINPYFSFTLQIILLFAVVILVLFLIILALDSLYRPNTQQYAEHWILDKVIPLIVLFVPSILIFTLSESKVTFLEKYTSILLIHCFVLVPLMYNWSKHRNWFLTKESFYKPWQSSKIFLHISIAIIYPAIWGIYFSILRPLRLGDNFDLTSINFSTTTLTVICLIILLWSYISIWIRFLLWKFLDLKIFLWHETSTLLYAINLHLLQYKIYFKITAILYKVSFLWISYLFYHPLIYMIQPKNQFRATLRQIYLKPLYLYIIILALILLELIITKGTIYYSAYIAITTLLLKPIFSLLTTFNGPGNSWVNQCCYSDYLYTQWEKPHYPKCFWLSFNDMRQEFNFYPSISEKDNNTLQELIKSLERIMYIQRNHEHSHFTRYYRTKKTSYHNRLKLNYYDWTNVRWVHTEVIIKTVPKLHNLTSFFARKWTDKIALINEN